MISIEFKIDEDELKEDLEMDIPREKIDLIVLTYFMMPVKIEINNTEIFNPPAPWMHLPIVNLASNGLLCIKRLAISKEEEYDLPEAVGMFIFKVLGNNEVQVNFRNRFYAVLKYQELLRAFLDFANTVRAFMWERVPQLNEHPYWGPWLRGERD